ncbi:Irc25p LALA0_S06e02938g [Lachancea lanzarotensis]|uniref:LALA0S06e02938g1_1 n=1 Tax=Lachancea lanzarotensis TaxID=1245769 RepID=A0A0C7MYC1_9SACH|nr:uncharacterized protein LALA0_S06e02938g [Lachancea lanzarotensis]CEP62750.1 LALA0S06e02938g1_1 [Lachancea lanzarotensis]
MFAADYRTYIPDDLQLGSNCVLETSAVHFNNKVLVQIRFNGELDQCLEVTSRGLPASSFEATKLYDEVFQNSSQQKEENKNYEFDNDDDSFTLAEDYLSNFQISTRLGDSNDMKLPIVCSQIAELYYKVIFPSNADKLRDVAPTRDFVISLSGKFFRKSSTDNDFRILLHILQAIRSMYT